MIYDCPLSMRMTVKINTKRWPAVEMHSLSTPASLKRYGPIPLRVKEEQYSTAGWYDESRSCKGAQGDMTDEILSFHFLVTNT